MMCQSIGRPPTSTMGLGRYSVSSRMRVPMPPHSSTTLGPREGVILPVIGRSSRELYRLSGHGPRLKCLPRASDCTGMAPSADHILALVAEYAAERHARPAFDPAD